MTQVRPNIILPMSLRLWSLDPSHDVFICLIKLDANGV